MKIKNGGFTGAHASPYPTGSMGSHDLPEVPEGGITQFIEKNLEQRKALKAKFTEGGDPITKMFGDWGTALGKPDTDDIAAIHALQKDSPFFQGLRDKLGLGDDIVFYPKSVEPTKAEADSGVLMAIDFNGVQVAAPKIKLKEEYNFDIQPFTEVGKRRFNMSIDPARSDNEVLEDIAEERADFLDGFKPKQ